MSSIVPTIGRKVWFWSADPGAVEVLLDFKQALDATVVYVSPTGTVNLLVLDHGGNSFPVEDIPLNDPGLDDEHGLEGAEDYATWMPYQVKQVTTNPV